MIERRNSVGRAAGWSTAGALIRMALNFIGMVILARLVAPEEFGVFAVASSLVLLVAYLAEIGSSWALVQRAEVRPDHAGSALIFAGGCALAAGAGLVLFSGVIADLMNMPSLQGALMFMALVIPIQAASGVPRALLKRDLAFDRLVRVDLAAAIAGLAAGLAHAWYNPSVISLLTQAIIYQVALALGLWSRRARQAIGHPSLRAFRELLSFAGGQTLYEFLMLLAKNLDTFLIARLVGAAPLGLYSRAFALMFTPLGQVYTAVGSVAFSAMSRNQHDRIALRRIHVRFFTGSLLGIAIPLAVFSAFSTDFVVVILGSEWKGSGPVLGVLAIAAALQVLYANMVWVLQATARLRAQLMSGALLAAGNVFGFILAAFSRDLTHFAIAYIFGIVLALIYVIRPVVLMLGAPLVWYLCAILFMGLATLLGKAAHAALEQLFENPLERLIGFVLTTATIAAFSLVLFRSRVRDLVNVAKVGEGQE